MKIILMSHFKLAEGLKNTLSYFNSSAAEDIVAISAYTEECADPQKELEKVLSKVENNEKVLIFTDILGGSVNQLCVPYLSNPNIYVFAGMNLSMLLQVTCFSGDESDEEIKALQEVGKEAVVCMNDYQFNEFSDDDE